MTGSITGYMDRVGQRPLHMSDYDRTVLAIRDGELAAFKELYPKVPDHTDELLIEVAGRSGAVCREMTAVLLDGRKGIGYPTYCADNEETMAALEEHWAELTQEQGGMTFG